MCQTRNRTNRLYGGAILLEVLIASALSIFIFGMLMQIFLISQHSYQLQVSLMQLDHTAQAAFSILRNDIKQAGYIGCAKMIDQLPEPALTLLPDNSLVVRHACAEPVSLIRDAINSNELYVTNGRHFSPDDLLLISDCEKAERARVAEVDAQTIYLSGILKNNYFKHAEVSKFEVNHYFVAKTKRFYQDAKSIYALYKQDIYGNREELVQDIESIHFLINQGVEITLVIHSLPVNKIRYAFISTKN